MSNDLDTITLCGVKIYAPKSKEKSMDSQRDALSHYIKNKYCLVCEHWNPVTVDITLNNVASECYKTCKNKNNFKLADDSKLNVIKHFFGIVDE